MKSTNFYWCVRASLGFEHYGISLKGRLVEVSKNEILFEPDKNYNLLRQDLILINYKWYEISEIMLLSEIVNYKLKSI